MRLGGQATAEFKRTGQLLALQSVLPDAPACNTVPRVMHIAGILTALRPSSHKLAGAAYPLAGISIGAVTGLAIYNGRHAISRRISDIQVQCSLRASCTTLQTQFFRVKFKMSRPLRRRVVSRRRRSQVLWTLHPAGISASFFIFCIVLFHLLLITYFRTPIVFIRTHYVLGGAKRLRRSACRGASSQGLGIGRSGHPYVACLTQRWVKHPGHPCVKVPLLADVILFQVKERLEAATGRPLSSSASTSAKAEKP